MIHRVSLCLFLKVVGQIQLESIRIKKLIRKEMLLMVILKTIGLMTKQDHLAFVSNLRTYILMLKIKL